MHINLFSRNNEVCICNSL